jgi:hypothetical protein
MRPGDTVRAAALPLGVVAGKAEAREADDHRRPGTTRMRLVSTSSRGSGRLTGRNYSSPALQSQRRSASLRFGSIDEDSVVFSSSAGIATPEPSTWARILLASPGSTCQLSRRSILAGFHYDGATGFAGGDLLSGNSFIIQDNEQDRYIQFDFANPLVSGGVNPLLPPPVVGSGSFECNNCVLVRTVLDGGDARTIAVPELSTWAMLLVGFAGLGFARYRADRPQQDP